MSSGNQRKLGYEAQKAIFQELKIDKRRRLSQICPEIRNANKMFPYIFDEVKLDFWNFQFDNLKWCFDCCEPHARYHKPREEKINICLHSSNGLLYETSRNIEKDAFFDLLLTEYVRPGTVIRKLSIDDGTIMENMSLSNVGPLNVEELKVYLCHDYQNLKKIISVIDEKCILKKLKIGVDSESADILDEPIVRNAESLDLSFRGLFPDEIAEKLMDLTNNTLILDSFSMEQVYELGKKWISTKREVGTKFIMLICNYAILGDVIKYFKPKFPESYMSRVISLGNSRFADSLTVPINEDAVLVVYGGENDRNCLFLMEIMKKEDVRPQIAH